MKNKKLNSALASLTIGAAVISLGALTAFAQSPEKAVGQMSSSTRAAARAAKIGAQLEKMAQRGEKEIDRRDNGLTKLSDRIQSMKKISDSDKSSLTATIESEISSLNALKLKIAADTDASTTRADLQSIAKSYRIFALIMPKAAIMAAADRSLELSDTMATVGTKLQTRIATAQSQGKDVAAVNTLLSDYNAKIADAKVQATAAVNEVSALVPDNGVKAVMDSNNAALKDARKKIQAAHADLVAARKDAEQITKALRAFGKPAPTATSTATSTGR